MPSELCIYLMVVEQQIIKVTCPARVDFTGGFTDILPFRSTQWVSHINLAVDLPTKVILKAQSGGLITIENKRDNVITSFSTVDDIEDRFSLIRTALRKFGVERNVSIIIDSRAPYGAGLGTSGALSVALVASLTLFTGQSLSDDLRKLAVAAAEIERISGVWGGLQDQFASAVGGCNVFRFHGSEYSQTRIPLSNRFIEELGQHLFILYPGGNRQSTDIVTRVMEEYRSGTLTVRDSLQSLNNLAQNILEALLVRDWKILSSLLYKVREQQLKLHPRIIDKGNRKIVNDLMSEGIEGVKLLGGGGSGTCLLVVLINDKSRQALNHICEVNEAEIIPVQCAKDGVHANVNHLVPII